MTQTLKIDELNIIPKDVERFIEEYFDVMTIPVSEIKRRVELARVVYVKQHAFLTALKADIDAGKNIDAKKYADELSAEYKAILEEEEYDDLEDYLDAFVDEFSKKVTETASKHPKNDYYFSEEKAAESAVNFANAVENNEYEKRMIAQGYTEKSWETMNDYRVRASHILVDGTRIPIDATFKVGDSEMRFPMDISLGASLSEVINCRCSCKYYK